MSENEAIGLLLYAAFGCLTLGFTARIAKDKGAPMVLPIISALTWPVFWLFVIGWVISDAGKA